MATGLAVTGAGGDVLFIEATAMDGDARLTLTGQLGDVMKESAHIALSYLRAHGPALGVDPAAAAHAARPRAGRRHPEGRPVRRHHDGDGTGSLASGRPVRSDVGMTGEVTLGGRVLPIGGVKQKLLAAHRAGLRTIFLPARNEPDLDDVPESVRDVLDIRLVADVADLVREALAGSGAPEQAAAA